MSLTKAWPIEIKKELAVLSVGRPIVLNNYYRGMSFRSKLHP